MAAPCRYTKGAFNARKRRGTIVMDDTLQKLVSGVALLALCGWSAASAVAQPPPIPFASVPESHVQPFGPTYLYRIGRYEITNEEFAVFLNDAWVNPQTDGGAFLSHDTTAGRVVLSGDGTLVFDASAGGAIAFDAAADDEAGAYLVAAGKERFPVVGVTWYGALKFCNWLTLAQGMTQPDQRAYTEGPTAADWRPRTADPATYAGNDLTAGERQLLVTQCRGFRLPMDQRTSTAAPFNEWYKAAAWLNGPRTNAVYGYGRDTLAAPDANYRDSNDPWEAGLAPVGFFGVNGNRAHDDPTFGWGFDPPATFTVRNTANGYGLFDLTGNAAEWVQDFGSVAGERGIRGGHFDSVVGSPLLTNAARGARPANAASLQVGFRVVQTLVSGGLAASTSIVRIEGFVGGPYAPATVPVQISHTSPQTLDGLTVQSSASWLEVDGTAPTFAPPASDTVVTLTVKEDALPSPPAAPPPPGNFALVPAGDFQPGGPMYDFWIARAEVTNTDFAAFLNDARTNAVGPAPDARSAHMYFDIDSGDVYLHDQTAAAVGTTAPTPTIATKLFDAAIGRIRFLNGAHTVAPGYADHPVVGVSWFGAVKYCNWRSIREGIPLDLLAYTEAPSPNLAAWRPVTADDVAWAPGAFSAAARDRFVRDTLGYRLPMDNESSAAAAFNEWHKAASYRGLDSAGVPAFGAEFGFGRDALTPSDANFAASGALASDGSTPVDFYDGVRTLFAEPGTCNILNPPTTRTHATGNGYALLGACGNVAEWVQDFGATAGERGTRGGGWRDSIDSHLLTATARGSRPADLPADDVGFRIVRGTGHRTTVTVSEGVFGGTQQRHFLLDLREPLELTPRVLPGFSWLYRNGYSVSGTSFTLTNHSAADMDWTLATDAEWLHVVAAGTGQPPGRDLAGTLAPASSLSAAVFTFGAAAMLAPGAHTATLTLTNETSGTELTRQIRVTVSPPLLLAANQSDPLPFTGLPGGPFVVNEGTPQSSLLRDYTLTGLVDFPLVYEISVNQPWLTLEPADELTGTFVPGATLPLSVATNDEAAILPVGTHTAQLRVSFTDPANGNTAGSTSQPISLIVRDWLNVTQPAEPWSIPFAGGAAVGTAQTYRVSNPSGPPIEVDICTEADWLDVAPDFVEVFPGEFADVVVAVNEAALELLDGDHRSAIVMENALTGTQYLRRVELLIDENFHVQPSQPLIARGIAGGPILPPGTVYSLVNASDAALDWTATIAYAPGSGTGWLRVNAQTTAVGTLSAGASLNLVVTIDAAQTVALSAGVHQATVNILDTANGASFNRAVSLTLVVPTLSVDEVVIPATPPQPNGPAYPFAMGRFEVTNAEFVAFLNDALANLANERGAYLYIDTLTGDVYANYDTIGERGVGPGTRTVKLFSPSAAGQITFDGATYTVNTLPNDFTHHPVTGVSWYGALKFCNWLTIDQGLFPADRCYHEATAWTINAWRPVAVSEAAWTTRDLIDTERQSLVTTCRGFRLPMDDGYQNANPAADAADDYNEWYKAAAWHPATGVHRLFGFGRDALTVTGPNAGRDANFRCSGDPFEDPLDCLLGGSTPVGYYGGINQSAAYAALPNANAFDIYDLTGNAYEWMQGRYSSQSGNLAFRTVRGGSWNDPATSAALRNNVRTFAPVGFTNAQIGFRVVRTLPADGDIDRDGDVDLVDFLLMGAQVTGPGDPASTAWAAFDLDGDGDIDLADFAAFQMLFSG